MDSNFSQKRLYLVSGLVVFAVVIFIPAASSKQPSQRERERERGQEENEKEEDKEDRGGEGGGGGAGGGEGEGEGQGSRLPTGRPGILTHLMTHRP